MFVIYHGGTDFTFQVIEHPGGVVNAVYLSDVNASSPTACAWIFPGTIDPEND